MPAPSSPADEVNFLAVYHQFQDASDAAEAATFHDSLVDRMGDLVLAKLDAEKNVGAKDKIGFFFDVTREIAVAANVLRREKDEQFVKLIGKEIEGLMPDLKLPGVRSTMFAVGSKLTPTLV
jgi:hypothetical protein